MVCSHRVGGEEEKSGESSAGNDTAAAAVSGVVVRALRLTDRVKRML